MHVHVGHPDGEAKFWISPAIKVSRRGTVTYADHRSRGHRSAP
ncbi:MAG: hypothetical protein M3R65_10860 [Gemmatimonadota bacterium]|nr:hypothetical protein [Gemmatimonadota bacterium]